MARLIIGYNHEAGGDMRINKFRGTKADLKSIQGGMHSCMKQRGFTKRQCEESWALTLWSLTDISNQAAETKKVAEYRKQCPNFEFVSVLAAYSLCPDGWLKGNRILLNPKVAYAHVFSEGSARCEWCLDYLL